MTTQRNERVNQVYAALVAAPNELNPTVGEVLSACGRFVSAILREGYSDQAQRQNVVNWFAPGLQSAINRECRPSSLTNTTDAGRLKEASPR